ncbi:DUF4291 domain-containing protein [Actinomadura rubteroloni]|uniref:DUF4291 domain-containing protein n=1 Tax=Actinomadura rubteroloni TaxID=1926885 RepID=UPI000CD80683|nr:DUF4291 domain-containing protein [Actinomadura rubteroloni]
MELFQIRADHDRDSIVVYQAYGKAIGGAAVAAGRFVPPFSRTRMTWIKPSFLWLMARSGWARKPGQEMVLGVRISRAGWESALDRAVLTGPDRSVFRDAAEWRAAFKRATVHVQWDPERTIHGAPLDARSIQVGISRHVIGEYADTWVREITDLTPLVRKIHGLLLDGRTSRAKALLPKERPYPFVAPHLRLGA